MRKNIIKMIGMLLMSILFLNPAFAVELIQGKRIAIGGYQGLFVDDAGKVWQFNAREENPSPPRFIMDDGKFVYTDENGDTYYVIRKDGSLWGFGKSDSGQLGIETKSSSEIVELRQLLPAVRSIAVTQRNVFAIKPDGSLWAWGDRGQQRGDKLDKVITTPRKIMDKVKLVSAGPYLTFALKKDNSL